MNVNALLVNSSTIDNSNTHAFIITSYGVMAHCNEFNHKIGSIWNILQSKI